MRKFIKNFNDQNKKSKLFSEAEGDTPTTTNEDVNITENIVEPETNPETNTNEVPEENEDELADFNFENQEIIEDAEEGNDNKDEFIDEENLFQNDENEESPAFRRKVRQLNLAYVNLYTKYRGVIDILKSRDLSGDKALLVNDFINEYESTLQKLVDYQDSNDDPYQIRFKTFIELRTAFILINNKLENVEKDVALLS